MTDHFALLGEPRCPWLDPELLKARFSALAAETHPDRFHNASPAEREAATRRAAELNTAHTTLRDVKSRLLHLLELELGRRPTGIEQAPPDMMDLFMQVGQLCQEVDRFRQEQAPAGSPMLKVKLFQQGLLLTERLQARQAVVRERMAALEAALLPLNAAWEQAPAPGSAERASRLPLARVEEIARAWSFANRWMNQLQERIAALAL